MMPVMDFTTIVFALFFYAIGLAILYWVIKTAIRHALISHYKVIRWYEKTGEWSSGSHGTDKPRDFSTAK